MFRRARWFILLAIVAIIASVTSVFLIQRRAIRRQRPKLSAPLADNTLATAERWKYELTSGDKAKIVIYARRFEQIKEPATFLFEGLEMEIHNKSGKGHDVVKSERAHLDQGTGQMYSEGDVEITMNVPEDAEPSGRLLKIRTSGATLDVKTSHVSTDRAASFEFEHGSGECVGALYDPSTKQLVMKSEVKLDWQGKDDKKPPMHVEAGTLTYLELGSEIQLSPYSRLRRGDFALDAATSVVFLKAGRLDRVEAQKATGMDKPPGRQLEYAADYLNMFFTPKAEIQRIEASDNARLTSTSVAGRVDTTAGRFDLEFDASPDGSTLKRVYATQKARVESRAATRPGAPPPGPRILTSEVIELNMRPGGKEIDRVLTHTPGQVEFLPATKADKKRTMNGERIYIDYGANNAIRSFRSVQVTTRTESVGKNAKTVVSVTKSRDLKADFDPQTGQMTRLEQWNDFQYEEGTRRATADRATLESARELITLQTKARMWDETGSTAADEIILEQQTGDMVATGNVTSTRMPDAKQSSDGLLKGGEPVQAKAQRMASTERSTKIRYEGDALLWQAGSRLQAKTIFIDKTAQTLDATGNVISELPDRRPKKGGNVFTIVKAPALAYSDKSKQAVYTGGVTLDRPGLNVKSSQLVAWFEKEPKAGGGDETKLDHMIADGDVRIVDRSPVRTITGNSEHAEYYLDDEHMVLTRGNPVVEDSRRGVSRGAVITWYARQDSMTVDNSGAGPAVSRINNKKK
jgi:lipopolysaccharide export system protein LptA